MKDNTPVVPYDSFRGAVCMALNAQYPDECKKKIVDALNKYPPESEITRAQINDVAVTHEMIKYYVPFGEGEHDNFMFWVSSRKYVKGQLIFRRTT